MNNASAVRSALPAGAALEARFGLRVAARLNEASAELPHDISERLRIARQQALARVPAKAAARQTAAAPMVVGQGGAALLGEGGDGRSPWWVRMGSLLPLLALLAGIVLIHEWTYQEQIAAAATVDAALLSDALPPSAYTDPGFDEFLRTPDATTVVDTAQ